MGLEKHWLKEYSKKGIPSSFRKKPSGAVTYFYDFLEKQGKTGGRILDLGCGKGRNSIFFAKNGWEAYSIDFVPEVIDELKNHAKKNNLKLTAMCQSVTEKMPFPENHFDVVIDIFCYKHQTDKQNQKKFRNELYRILKKDGLYLLSLAGEDDGFYGPLLKNSTDKKNKLIVDPVTKVPSFLYSKQDVEKEFADFEIIDFQHKKKIGKMHGREYERSTLIFIMKKKF